MTREAPPIDLDDIKGLSELIRLVEEVRSTRTPRTLRRDHEDVAVLMPPRASKRRRDARADALAVVERTAGIFKQYAKSPPPTPQEEKDAFEQAVAEEAMERLKG